MSTANTLPHSANIAIHVFCGTAALCLALAAIFSRKGGSIPGCGADCGHPPLQRLYKRAIIEFHHASSLTETPGNSAALLLSR